MVQPTQAVLAGFQGSYGHLSGAASGLAIFNSGIIIIRGHGSASIRVMPGIIRNHHSNPHLAVVFPVYFGRGIDPEDNEGDTPRAQGAAPHEDLPYRVELWDQHKKTVEVVLAVTANSSIGYAAYHAATREHPDRYVTFRHKNRTIAKINGPEH